MFEQASKIKLRFTTPKGVISVEDLWDVPLTSPTKFSLDLIARNLSKTLKEAEEESFVKPLSTDNTIVKLRFDIVKHVISIKLAEAEAAKTAAAKRARKAELLSLLAEQDREADKGKSREDLLKELNELV